MPQDESAEGTWLQDCFCAGLKSYHCRVKLVRGARTWDRGKEGGLGANSCLDNLSSEEQIRPTTFFGTNQAEEEKLEGEASLLVTAFANFLSAAFPSPLHLPVPNLMVYLSSVHSGILAPAKAARYCCKTPRMLLMNPLDKGKRGNPISG